MESELAAGITDPNSTYMRVLKWEIMLVYQTEVCAIKKSAGTICARNRKGAKVYIMSDSQVVLKAFLGHSFEPLLTLQYPDYPFKSLVPETVLNLSGYRIMRKLERIYLIPK